MQYIAKCRTNWNISQKHNTVQYYAALCYLWCWNQNDVLRNLC